MDLYISYMPGKIIADSKANSDITGRRFGKLTAVERTEPFRPSYRWECLCDCGFTCLVDVFKLLNGHTKTCGCSKFVNLAGYRSGKLTALRVVDRRSKYALWECLCDCGNTISVVSGKLTSRRVVSCGCAGKGPSRLPEDETAFGRCMQGYVYRARRRLLEFSIDTDTIRELFSGDCLYCGAPPSTLFNPRKCSPDISPYRNLLYNGIDRVDNGIGYIEGNVVSCCEQCNRAKGSGTLGEFLRRSVNVARRLEQGITQTALGIDADMFRPEPPPAATAPVTV